MLSWKSKYEHEFFKNFLKEKFLNQLQRRQASHPIPSNPKATHQNLSKACSFHKESINHEQLAMRWQYPPKCFPSCWLSTITYPMHSQGIITLLNRQSIIIIMFYWKFQSISAKVSGKFVCETGKNKLLTSLHYSALSKIIAFDQWTHEKKAVSQYKKCLTCIC